MSAGDGTDDDYDELKALAGERPMKVWCDPDDPESGAVMSLLYEAGIEFYVAPMGHKLEPVAFFDGRAYQKYRGREELEELLDGIDRLPAGYDRIGE